MDERIKEYLETKDEQDFYVICEESINAEMKKISHLPNKNADDYFECIKRINFVLNNWMKSEVRKLYLSMHSDVEETINESQILNEIKQIKVLEKGINDDNPYILDECEKKTKFINIILESWQDTKKKEKFLNENLEVKNTLGKYYLYAKYSIDCELGKIGSLERRLNRTNFIVVIAICEEYIRSAEYVLNNWLSDGKIEKLKRENSEIFETVERYTTYKDEIINGYLDMCYAQGVIKKMGLEKVRDDREVKRLTQDIDIEKIEKEEDSKKVKKYQKS